MKNNTQLKGDLDHVQEVNEDSQDYILKDLQKDLESQMNLLDSINQSLDKQAKKKKPWERDASFEEYSDMTYKEDLSANMQTVNSFFSTIKREGLNLKEK